VKVLAAQNGIFANRFGESSVLCVLWPKGLPPIITAFNMPSKLAIKINDRKSSAQTIDSFLIA
jgi:hypothetical protein